MNEIGREPGYGIVEQTESVDRISSNVDLSAFEMAKINSVSREYALRNYLNRIKQSYYYVLIACMLVFVSFILRRSFHSDVVCFATIEATNRTGFPVQLFRQVSKQCRLQNILPLRAVTKSDFDITNSPGSVK